jgi:RecB family exonuclease
MDYITGTIDRIIGNRDGLREVVDYKTNRISSQNLNQAAGKYDWQIKTYALLLSRLYPDQETYPVSLFFVKPDLLYVRNYKRADMLQIEDEFLDILSKIKKTMPVDL